MAICNESAAAFSGRPASHDVLGQRRRLIRDSQQRNAADKRFPPICCFSVACSYFRHRSDTYSSNDETGGSGRSIREATRRRGEIAVNRAKTV